MANKKKPKQQVEYRALSEIKPLDNNPRYIKTDDFERLCASVQNNADYFECRPIILSDRTGELVIIAGNQRYKAAQEVGLKEVPTILLHGLTEAKEKEIVIRDNVQNGKWDYDILASGAWGEIDSLADWGVEGVSFLTSDDDLMEVNDDDLENLQEGGFQNELRENTNSFQMSFVFPLDKKPQIDEFVKKNGKEFIVNKIVEMCCTEEDSTETEIEDGDNTD